MRDVSRMADEERERFIQSTGQLMLRAYRLGQRDEAVRLRECMYAAIHARSPAKRAAMQVEIERRVTEGVCYFSSDAALAQGRAGGGR